MKPNKRTTVILEIKALEVLDPLEEGVELNEGYEFELHGSIPQVADGIAKLLHELDKDKNLSEKNNAGLSLLGLINEYYALVKEQDKETEVVN